MAPKILRSQCKCSVGNALCKSVNAVNAARKCLRSHTNASVRKDLRRVVNAVNADPSLSLRQCGREGEREREDKVRPKRSLRSHFDVTCCYARRYRVNAALNPAFTPAFTDSRKPLWAHGLACERSPKGPAFTLAPAVLRNVNTVSRNVNTVEKRQHCAGPSGGRGRGDGGGNSRATSVRPVVTRTFCAGLSKAARAALRSNTE